MGLAQLAPSRSAPRKTAMQAHLHGRFLRDSMALLALLALLAVFRRLGGCTNCAWQCVTRMRRQTGVVHVALHCNA
jgi:hypothetical protein